MRFKALLTIIAATTLSCMAQQAPKYIFYYIGDGMGMGPVNAAETYNRMVLHGSEPLLMHTFPVVGWSQTYSASVPVTDSAAAGTALATGHKTKNGMLGMRPDSTDVTSIATELFERGYGVGIATSVAADDATPGAFYAHVPHRKMFYPIDSLIAQCGFQFIAGAGIQGLKDAHGNPTDIPQLLEAAGITVVRGPEGAASEPAPRKLLLNTEGTQPWNIGYTIDSIAGVLSLPEIAQACLRQLTETSPERFFMMVEGGNIDHALHANDGGAAVKEILNFNQALAVAFDFYRQHPDETLIVVTADHDTGGMALQWNAINIHNIDYQRISKERFSEYCKNLLNSRAEYTWEDMKQYLQDNLGLFGPIVVSEENENKLHSMFNTTFEQRRAGDDQQTLYASFNSFAVEVFRLFNNAAGFAFTNTGHSGNPVPVYAVGCGASLFSGFTNNTDIPARIRAIAGLH